MEQSAPTTVAALAASLHQHPNTIREHLDGLVADGLATRTRAPIRGRGRPAWQYRATGGRLAEGGTGEYLGLAVALADHISRTCDEPAAAAAVAGERWGRSLVSGLDLEESEEPVERRRRLAVIFDRLGFGADPDEDASTVRLRRCPLLEAAHENQAVVCGVHLGMTRAVLRELGEEDPQPRLVPFAERGACLLHLSEP